MDLLGVDTGAAPAGVAPAPGGRRATLVVLAGVAVVLAWSLLAGGAPPPERPDAADTTAPATTSTTVRRSTTTATTRRTTTTSPEDLPVRVLDGAPLASVPTGLTVVYPADGALFAVELDTGTLVRLADLAYEPLLLDAGRVLVRSPTDGGLVVVPYRPAEGPPVRVDLQDANTVDPAGAGLAWASVWGEDGPSWALVDLATGAVLEVVQPGNGPTAMWWGSVGGPDLVSSMDGGVYERGDDGYRLVARGVVAARTADAVLVRRCDERLSCGVRWLEAGTWRELDRPAPVGEYDEYRVSPGGRWLVAMAYQRAQRTSVIDVATGEAVLELETYLAASAFSPDDRFLLVLGPGGEPTLHELGTGSSQVITGVRGLGQGAVLLAASPPDVG